MNASFDLPGTVKIKGWNGGTSIGREMADMMDEILICDRALSEAEILYHAGQLFREGNMV